MDGYPGKESMGVGEGGRAINERKEPDFVSLTAIQRSILKLVCYSFLGFLFLGVGVGGQINFMLLKLCCNYTQKMGLNPERPSPMEPPSLLMNL